MATLARAVSQKIRILGPVPPPHGGVSVYVNGLRQLLKGEGVRTWSYPYKNADEPDITFFKHRRLGIVPLMLRDGYGARVLDASHFHLEYPNLLLVSIWLILKGLLRFEWIKMIHDGSLPIRFAQFSPMQERLFKVAARFVTEFVVVNDELHAWLKQQVKPGQKITTIGALLPVAREANVQLLSDRLPGALSEYLLRTKHVCSIGVFKGEYGFNHVAEAVESLRAETGVDIGLLLLDGVFVRDENYRNRVLQGRDWITVLENVPHRDVFPILKSSDVFVRAFGQESYGLSRVEAIWCGVPVVATNVGETRGMLTYEFGDVAELKRQLRRALFDPPRDLTEYATMFYAEADRNLQRISKVLGLE